MTRVKQHKWYATVTVLLLLSLIFSGLAMAHSAKSTAPKVSHAKTKNVILFVGDGMGAAQREAIRLSKVGMSGTLEMDQMPYTGSMHTRSTSVVTDSAAAATAFAPGIKTNNGYVGMTPSGKSVRTVLEAAHDAGKSTGLVTTSQITDATPAAFAAHVQDRSQQSDIANQYLTRSHVDVLLGGGEDFWYPKGKEGAFKDHPSTDSSEASKGTKGNLVTKAKRYGYAVVTNRKNLLKTTSHKLLGLFANEEMFQQKPEGKRDSYNPTVSLPTMTQKAIQALSVNKEGFFLMVEEEAIDEMAHQNNADLTIKAGKQLDQSIKVAKDYAKKHPDTLVLTLADHECGGMAIEAVDNNDNAGSRKDGPFKIAHSDQQFTVDWTTNGHSAVDVPVTATGKNASLFAGNYENTHIHDALLKAMRIK